MRRPVSPGQPSAKRPVAVLGAGIAGLVAATCLAAEGVSVVVFEAREVPGGKIRTVREPFATGLYAELGPWRIPPQHHLVRKYAESVGLTLRAAPDNVGDVEYFVRDRRFDDREVERDPTILPYDLLPNERTLGPSRLWDRMFAPLVQRGIDPLTDDWPADIAGLNRLSLGDYLRREGLSNEAVRMCGDMLGVAPFLETGFLPNLREELLAYGVDTGFVSIPGGNDQLPRRLADRLGPAVHLSSEVVALQQRSDGVQLTVSCEGEKSLLSASQVIIALPAPILRRLSIDPPLSSEKQEALQQVSYADATKLVLQCSRSAVEELRSGRYSELRTDLPMQSVRFSSFEDAPGKAIVTVYVMGGSGATAGTASADIPRCIVGQLARVFPSLPELIEQNAFIQWEAEPHARGAYPTMMPGQDGELLGVLARPEGRLHFAGDYASALPGWMHGAISSGERAAHEVLMVHLGSVVARG